MADRLDRRRLPWQGSFGSDNRRSVDFPRSAGHAHRPRVRAGLSGSRRSRAAAGTSRGQGGGLLRGVLSALGPIGSHPLGHRLLLFGRHRTALPRRRGVGRGLRDRGGRSRRPPRGGAPSRGLRRSGGPEDPSPSAASATSAQRRALSSLLRIPAMTRRPAITASSGPRSRATSSDSTLRPVARTAARSAAPNARAGPRPRPPASARGRRRAPAADGSLVNASARAARWYGVQCSPPPAPADHLQDVLKVL